jgi:hypothetical protein
MFRFTIRELVLLTVVVAMGIGWWVDRRPTPAVMWERRASALAEFLRDDGWRISWDAHTVEIRRGDDYRAADW